jgi:hypothetical protein
VISVFCVFPWLSDTLATFVLGSRILVLPPRVRAVFCLGSPSTVSVENEPFSYLRFVL